MLGSARRSVASICPVSEQNRKGKLMSWTVNQLYSTLKASFHHVRGSFGSILIWLGYLQQSIWFHLQLMLQRPESWVRNSASTPWKWTKVTFISNTSSQRVTGRKTQACSSSVWGCIMRSRSASLLSALGLCCLTAVLPRAEDFWSLWEKALLGFDLEIYQEMQFCSRQKSLESVRGQLGPEM